MSEHQPHPGPSVPDWWKGATRNMLDVLAGAVARYRREGRRGIEWTWDREMTDRERVAFDLWLVRTGDQLATFAGTPENRFKCRVLAMALDRPAVNSMGLMDLSEPSL